MAELSQADRALLQQAQQQARARMSGRTIDETGKDISELQGQPELVWTGWYWTGTHTVWVVGRSANGSRIFVQYKSEADWLLLDICRHWQRVHEAVRESGLGFGWRPDR
jgi:hypothetical protein